MLQRLSLKRLQAFTLWGVMVYCILMGMVRMESFDFWTHLDLARSALRSLQDQGHSFLSLLQGKGFYGSLGSLIIYGFYQFFGEHVITLLTMAASGLIFLPFCLQLGRAVRPDRHLFLALILLSVAVVRFRYLPRPELFGYIIYAWLTFLLLRYRREPSLSRIVLCICGLAVWFYLHITWTMGLLFLGLNFLHQPRTDYLLRLWNSRRGRFLAAVLLVGTAFVGWKGAKFLFYLVKNMEGGQVLNLVNEMQPTWGYPSVFCWYLVASLLALVLIWCSSDRKWLGFVSWCLAFAVGAYVERNVAMATLGMLSFALIGNRSVRWQSYVPPAANLVVALLLLAGTFFWFEPRVGYGVAWPLFPRDSARFVINNHLPAPIFNNWDGGGYLRWAWDGHPRHFMDGTLFSAERLKIHDAVINGQNLAFLRTNNFQTLVLQGSYCDSGRIYPVVPWLFFDPDWKLVFAGDALVFTKKSVPVAGLSASAGWTALLARLDYIQASGVDQPHYYYSKGATYVAMGDGESARKMFAKAVSRQPQLRGFYRRYAVYFPH